MRTSSFTNTNPAILEVLGKDKQKFTIIHVGVMGASKTLAVTRGVIETESGPRIAFSEPRKRKMMAFDAPLEKGCIILKGHVERPLVDGDVPIQENGYTVRAFLIGGGPRLSSADGKDELMKFIADNCVMHTLDRAKSLDYVPGGVRDATPEPILGKMLSMLPPPVEVEEPKAAAKTRHKILTDVQLAALKAVPHGSSKPIQKIFGGAGTWLLCSMEEDGDTMWGFADIGFGVVEFGTISLRELEELRIPPLNMPLERDKFFDGCDYTMQELLSMESIPTGLRKRPATV